MSFIPSSNQSKINKSNHFKLKLCGFIVEITCCYNNTVLYCKDYMLDSIATDFKVEIEINEILKEAHLRKYETLNLNYLKQKIGVNYVTEEAMIMCRKISEQFIKEYILLLHGAAISLNNRCYIFTAPSGTGKTTHILNWMKLFPETIIINGDKPLINTTTKLVYGTPWCGKEGYNTNTSAPLAGIISLERGETNSIKPITFHEMLPVLLKQTYIPKERELALKAYSLIGKFKDIPCYKLVCNMDEESARVAYDGIKANEERLG